MSIEPKISTASFKDAATIAQIQTQTWLTNYPNKEAGITKEDIQTKIDEWSQKGDERILREMQRSNSHTWIAKVGLDSVGFVAVSKNAEQGQIDALHILPQFQGLGIGTILFQIALDWLGKRKISLQVVNYNQRAISFYEKFGFAITGEANDDPINLPHGKVINKVLMIRSSNITQYHPISPLNIETIDCVCDY